MEKGSAVSRDFYIAAVTVAARLNEILQDARNISMEAMNAKVLVARGGHDMQTFKPIADHMKAFHGVLAQSAGM